MWMNLKNIRLIKITKGTVTDMACMMFDCKYLYDFGDESLCTKKLEWIKGRISVLCRDCSLDHGCEYCIYRNTKCKDLVD